MTRSTPPFPKIMIELGNPVWCDAPNSGDIADGVQNPGSPDVPLAGVTVDLSCDGGTLNAFTTTDGDGIATTVVTVGGPGANDHSLDFGFSATPVGACVDEDGDGICNESCVEDRDGDGTSDCMDFDPQGYFYCETTGDIVPGGSVAVSGPGAVNLVDDGSSGEYMFLTDGTPGVYSMMVTPPPGASLSTICPELGTLDPTGSPDPLVLGSGEIGNTGVLASSACGDNPYHLTFDLAPGDPFILNNNIPLGVCPAPIADIPTVSEWGLILLGLLLAAGGVFFVRQRLG